MPVFLSVCALLFCAVLCPQSASFSACPYVCGKVAITFDGSRFQEDTLIGMMGSIDPETNEFLLMMMPPQVLFSYDGLVDVHLTIVRSPL